MRAVLLNEKGQAVVESALILPILIIMILGIVEFGRLSNAYMVVTHAARHGARYGAVGSSNQEIMDRVKDAAVPLDPARLTIKIEPAQNRASGGDIEVTVSYPVQLITPLPIRFIANPVTVASTVTMRLE